MSKLPVNDMDPSQATDTMNRIMQHYTTHHDVVIRKLGHAQNATEITAKEENVTPVTPAIQSSAWGEIIAMFEKCGITQEELFEIEGILDTLPANIRPHFERLVKLDQMLQTMMKTMKALNYADAKKIADQIQSAPNPLSGLTPDEYETEEETSEKDRIQAFKIMR